jgi:hypothetical protein
VASMRDRRRLVAAFVCSLALAACDRTAQNGQDDEVPAGDTDAGRIDAELAAACDTIARRLREVMVGAVDEARGQYTGSIRGIERHGCHFTATDTLSADAPQRPLEAVWLALAEQGWVVDQAYAAEETEGRMVGMRNASILCVLQHYWDVGSDDDRASDWLGPVAYHVRAECFRESPRRPAN